MLSALEQRGRTRVQPPLLRLEITANPTAVPLFFLRKNTRRIQVLHIGIASLADKNGDHHPAHFLTL
jgi:hypothetical protein